MPARNRPIIAVQTSRKRLVHNETDTELVDAIERLKRAGVSIKQAVRELRKCRYLIRKVYRGEHTAQLVGKRHERCPGCGGKQIIPCRVCAARHLRQSAA
jgi:hypothetical protein